MDTKKVFSLHQQLVAANVDVDTMSAELEKCKQRRDPLALIDTVLRRLAKDWRQPLNQLFKFYNVDRISMFKKDVPRDWRSIESGSCLYWPEELIPYPDGRNGLDTSCDTVQRGHVGPIAGTATQPCRAQIHEAYLIGHLHLSKSSRGQQKLSFGQCNHFRELLLCFECVSISPTKVDMRRCGDCIA